MKEKKGDKDAEFPLAANDSNKNHYVPVLLRLPHLVPVLCKRTMEVTAF